jgi:uroporphyrinogen III methyltransferase / synthase
MKQISPIGKIYLVGGGPGDPQLITVRGKSLLEQADFVLYDQLVGERILECLRPGCESMNIRDLPGDHPDRWPLIHQKMIEQAQLGKMVVRLKGGDPSIFGRVGEEAEACRDAGIEYEIIPGVTTALAAGACLDLPLTHRHFSSCIAFVTGHEHPNKPNSSLDWAGLAKFPGTLAIYMGIGRLGSISKALIEHGKNPATPCAIVSKVSTGEQLSVTSTIAMMENDFKLSGLVTPAILLVGDVAGLKPERSWFERRPLLGMRVMVTRPKQQAIPFMDRIEMLGGVASHLELMRIAEPSSWQPVDLTIEKIAQDEFQWLIFTSANGVSAFFDRLRTLGKDLRTLGRIKIAMIGTATSKKLLEWNLKADFELTEDMNSENLVANLRSRVSGQNLLLIQAEEGRDLLVEALGSDAQIERISVYRQESVEPDSSMLDRLRRGEVGVVVLTSPNLTSRLLAISDEVIRQRFETGQIKLLVNSHRSAAILREVGIPCEVSNGPDQESLIQHLLVMHSTS